MLATIAFQANNALVNFSTEAGQGHGVNGFFDMSLAWYLVNFYLWSWVILLASNPFFNIKRHVWVILTSFLW